MGLVTWEGSPKEKIHKYDVIVAKNYLNEFELKQTERIVAYLDMAELQTMRHIPMTMADWEKRLNEFLTMWDHEILQDAGKVSAELAKRHRDKNLFFQCFCHALLPHDTSKTNGLSGCSSTYFFSGSKYTIPAYNLMPYYALECCSKYTIHEVLGKNY